MKYATIRVRVEEPDFLELPDKPYDWDHSIYGDVHEDVPNETPRPLGKFVVAIHYVDAKTISRHYEREIGY